MSASSSHSCGLPPAIIVSLLVVSSGATHKACLSGNEVRGVHLPLRVTTRVKYNRSTPPLAAAAVEIMFNRQTARYRTGDGHQPGML